MTGPDIQENMPPLKGIIPEKNSDKLDFLNNDKFKDVKDILSKTINDLAKENIVSKDDFQKNIEQIVKKLFDDPTFDEVFALKEAQANNIYAFRTEFENVKQENANIEKQERIAKNRGELETKYTKIDKKYKIDPKDIGKIKENDPNVKEIPPEKQDLYISYLYAGQQIAKEARSSEKKTISKENYEFIQTFNKLDTDLGLGSPIDLTGLTIITEEPKFMSMSNINEKKEKTVERSMESIVKNDKLGTELVQNNSDVKSFVLDEESNAFDDKDRESNEDVNGVIGNKLGEWYKDEIKGGIEKLLGKNKLDTYAKNFDTSGRIIDDKNIPPEDKVKLEKISKKVIDTYTAKAQEKIFGDTNKIIKTKAVAALLQNIGQYFQIDNFAKDFTIDLKSGIEFNENELKLSGSMEGKDMTFYYDMNSGEVFADDFVHHNEEDKTFYIDRGRKGNKGREKLPLKMPTLADALDKSKIAHTANMLSSLENTKKLENYEEKLNKTSFKIGGESNVADIVIEHSMAKNIAIQETHEFLGDYLPNRKKYSYDNKPKEYNLYKIIDTSFDRYTTNEVKQWRNLLGRFNDKISAKKPGFKDEMIQGMFDDKSKEKDINEEYDKDKGPSIYQFIQALTYEHPGTIKNDVIDLNLFEQVVQRLEKTDGDTKSLGATSNKYKQLQSNRSSEIDKSDADELVESIA